MNENYIFDQIIHSGVAGVYSKVVARLRDAA